MSTPWWVGPLLGFAIGGVVGVTGMAMLVAARHPLEDLPGWARTLARPLHTIPDSHYVTVECYLCADGLQYSEDADGGWLHMGGWEAIGEAPPGEPHQPVPLVRVRRPFTDTRPL